jgi:RimJ/RimL family protein N-acetyltransferase
VTSDRSTPAGTFPLAVPADVLTDNVRARRFHEAAGWRADGTVRVLDFDGTPIDELRYRR